MLRHTNLVSINTEQVGSDISDSYEIFNIWGTQAQPYQVTVHLNNCSLDHDIEIDTGHLCQSYHIAGYFPWVQTFPNFTNRLTTQENLFWAAA